MSALIRRRQSNQRLALTPDPPRALRYHPLARCMALNERLEPCGVPYGQHGGQSHSFEQRKQYRVHLPWGRDVSYCGRADYMEIAVDADDQTVRSLGLQNRLCTGCFKTWLYIEQRKAFMLATASERRRA